MGGITTGVGLFSGIDTRSLIDQLIAVEARPRQLVEARIIQLQQQQAGYLSINSALNGLESAADAFLASKVFDSNKATSSAPGVLSASAGTNAAPGSYSFLVDRLVSTQQLLSRGFADRDSAALGATEFSFELGDGGVASDTTLAELNGGAGVERGRIEITDRSGATATIDLSTAVTVQDVLDRINGASGVSVSASIDGDRLVIDDQSGGALNLTVSDAFGSSTATSLGIAGSVAASSLTGDDIRYVSGATALGSLNDGTGIEISDGSSDLRITARDGSVLNIDLGEQRSQFFTEDWEGFSADDPVPDPAPDGIEDAPTEFRVTRARAATLQDVIDIINQAASDDGVAITAGINGDGTGLVITDTTGGGGNLIVESASDHTTAKDLGIATGAGGVAAGSVVGGRLIAGINSVLNASLNGGAGLTETALDFTDRSGASFSFSLTEAERTGSLSDVIDRINQELSGNGVGITASLNRAGNGVALADTSGGSGNLVVGGAAAAELGIETAGVASGTLDGSNLQKRWISKATLVEDLNVGQGIGTGEFRITDSAGGSAVFDIGSTIRTVGELLDFINTRPGVDVTASINASGDGIQIVDDAGGSNDLIIADETGTVARALNLRGEFADEGSGIVADGSYERRVAFDATDSLQEVVDKINAEGVGMSASIINDGSGANPYRISFTSRFSGAAGRAIVDTGALDLSLDTLSRGDDAVAFFGSDDPAKAVLLTSSTNSLDNVVQGVTIDLNSTSDDPVELVVTRDTAKIESAVQGLVDAYNSVIDAIDSQTFYDDESQRRGALLGDSTASNIRASLFRTIQSSPEGVSGQFDFLFQIGVSVGSGSKLELDTERFRSALEDDFESVETLLAASRRTPSDPIELAPGITTPNTEERFSERGLAQQIKSLVDGLTNSIDGLLTVRDQTIDSQIETQRDRIESINRQLDSKRARLEAQFLAMEQAIASLSTQQAALATLQTVG
jgi:flagellar hook-associated protein 2